MNWIFFLPLISACIGWLICWIAIKLLFHPRKPLKVFGFSFQGLLLKNQQRLAEKAGNLAGTSFFSEGDLEQQINNPVHLAGVMPMIDRHVDDFLQNKLTKEIPVLSMFIGNKTIATLKKTFMQEIEILLPEVMTQFSGNLKKKLDPAQFITKKIAEIPPEKIEKIITRQLSAEFRFTRFTGALIGFIIGVIQLVITLILR